MYRESDHMHAIALGSALNVGIRVVYLDRGEASTSPPEHDFPEIEHGCPSVYLLYRPGHYDILYKWETIHLQAFSFFCPIKLCFFKRV